MEETVKLKWYFRLFSKLDNEACNVDMTNRAVAWGIDWIAGSLITAFPTVIFYMALTKTQEVNQNLLAFDQPYGWVAGILSLLFCIAYYVIYPYRHNGQTCGKKFMDMKIVKRDGSDIDLKSLCKRQILGCIILEGCLIPGGSYVCQLLSLAAGYDLTLVLGVASGVICLLSIYIAMKKKSRRMIHDYLADTKVVAIEK